MRVFQPFLMERMMSRFEQEVEYNLSESGVHPVLLQELLDRENGYLQRLLETDLNYPPAAHCTALPRCDSGERAGNSRGYRGQLPRAKNPSGPQR